MRDSGNGYGTPSGSHSCNRSAQNDNFLEGFYTLELSLNLVELDPAYPKDPQILGEHIRKRRLDLGLFQRQVARQLGVNETTIHNWEVGATQPGISCVPKIIEFLSYNPFPSAGPLPNRLSSTERRSDFHEDHDELA